MGDCENFTEDFRDIFINGHHTTKDTSYCGITGEPCANMGEGFICPKEEGDL